jgi:hemolysin III
MPEEFANSITHGFGWVLSVVAGGALVMAACQRGDPWQIAGCAIYATTMIAVYGASTLSHAFRTLHIRRFFRILDQSFIYLMIAGTYTPLGLTYLRYGSWWILLALMWGVALAGCVSKIWYQHRVEDAAAWSYVLLGWMPVAAIRPLLDAMPRAAIWWMLVGGMCYTIGTLFLTYDMKGRYFHAVWHLLVIAGSACHYLAILRYVVAWA